MLTPESPQPSLSRREKDTLSALRSAGLVSSPQLSRLLALDPDNTRKRLRSLVANASVVFPTQGYALKIHLPRGYRYYAVTRPVGPALNHSVRGVFTNLLAESAASTSSVPDANLPDLLALLSVLAQLALPALPAAILVLPDCPVCPKSPASPTSPCSPRTFPVSQRAFWITGGLKAERRPVIRAPFFRGEA